MMKHIYKNLFLFIYLLICSLFWQGCNIHHEQTPTYIHIDSFAFKGNSLFPNVTKSHQINTVWVYYNNNPVGVFDLPATFPIMTNGAGVTGKLELSAGVSVNGQNDELSGYPFYVFDTSTFVSQPGKVIYHQPTTEFFDKVKITSISDFEGATHFSLWSPGGNIPMTIVNDDSLLFEGGYSGSILLSSPADSSVDSTIIPFAIPSGVSTFIEFDYKCSVPFYVGIQANQGTIISTTPFYLTGVNTSDHWQKFYLSVANFAAQYPATNYNLYIKTYLPPGYTRGRVLLDNIQLVTF